MVCVSPAQTRRVIMHAATGTLMHSAVQSQCQDALSYYVLETCTYLCNQIAMSIMAMHAGVHCVSKLRIRTCIDHVVDK